MKNKQPVYEQQKGECPFNSSTPPLQHDPSIILSHFLRFTKFSSTLTAFMTCASTASREILLFCIRCGCQVASLVKMQLRNVPPPPLPHINCIYAVFHSAYHHQFSTYCVVLEKVPDLTCPWIRTLITSLRDFVTVPLHEDCLGELLVVFWLKYFLSLSYRSTVMS